MKKDYLLPYFEKEQNKNIHRYKEFTINNIDFRICYISPFKGALVNKDTFLDTNGIVRRPNINLRTHKRDILKINKKIGKKEKKTQSLEEIQLKEDYFSEIGGFDKEIKKIKEIITLPLKNPEIFQMLGIKPIKGLLLHGPPGTGKTQIARAIANSLKTNFYYIKGPEILNKYIGETEAKLRQIFSEASKNEPSIIFIDEIDSIAEKRSDKKDLSNLVTTLLTLMDGLKDRGKIIVIGATNRINSLDLALRRYGRFSREIEIGIPEFEGRLEILKIHCKKMKLKDVDLKKIAERCYGFSGADIAHLCVEAGLNCFRDNEKIFLEDNKSFFDDNGNYIKDGVDKIKNVFITMKNFDEALEHIKPSSLREKEITKSDVKWEDIGGLTDIKKNIKETVLYPLKYKSKMLHYNLNPSRGALFFGPPGCGKTLLAKAIANEISSNFITISSSEILSKWYGDSEKNLKEIFNKANSVNPTILFFDEIDSFTAKRTNSINTNDTTNRLLNNFLIELDGLKKKKNIFIIGATNRPNIIDNAILRPGRIDQLIYIGLPDFKSRVSIFKACLRKSPIEKSVDFKVLGEKTKGMTGADIKGICDKTAKLAVTESIENDIRHQNRNKNNINETNFIDKNNINNFKEEFEDFREEIKMRHFLKVLEKNRISVLEEDLNVYEEFKRKYNI